MLRICILLYKLAGLHIDEIDSMYYVVIFGDKIVLKKVCSRFFFMKLYIKGEQVDIFEFDLPKHLLGPVHTTTEIGS